MRLWRILGLPTQDITGSLIALNSTSSIAELVKEAGLWTLGLTIGLPLQYASTTICGDILKKDRAFAAISSFRARQSTLWSRPCDRARRGRNPPRRSFRNGAARRGGYGEVRPGGRHDAPI